jgi:hypothetical protein
VAVGFCGRQMSFDTTVGGGVASLPVIYVLTSTAFIKLFSLSAIRILLQALLVGAVMLAPVFGQIHKIVHGTAVHHNHSNDNDHDHDRAHDSAAQHKAEHGLFSHHEEGSLLCLALDHLASGEGLQTQDASVELLEFKPLYLSGEFEPLFSDLLLAFSARAPPAFL